ncbi:MAG TPA: methylenetetrahydrofolate reductase C-terminal domain-containing protein [Syntrophorhabdales bacterium]|nr:methylenetetrahydrofolate reductase C-terminal domain-containing protein [Syntrophorhabdales bacterium]
MIAGTLKPIDEIVSSLESYKNIFILACGSCVTVCLSGGDREAHALARDLLASGDAGFRGCTIHTTTIQRQCEADLLNSFLEIPPGTEVVLSLACGAGVQTLAETLAHVPVLPALNTTFLGALDEQGVWREKCRGCGECVLAHTAGICPVARCAKHLLNGPCGGSSHGKCEIGNDVDCAWQLIIDRLKKMDRLDEYDKILSPKDWSVDGASGPRTMQRTANSLEL